jgi:hypothetical protein
MAEESLQRLLLSPELSLNHESAAANFQYRQRIHAEDEANPPLRLFSAQKINAETGNFFNLPMRLNISGLKARRH